MLPVGVGLVYLATPYSEYKLGIEQAFIDAAKLVARLVLLHVRVYSPIVHTHPIAIHGGIDPLDHSIWMPFDFAMMSVSRVIAVAMLDGWRESKGVNCEIDFFRAACKPVYFLDPITLQVSE